MWIFDEASIVELRRLLITFLMATPIAVLAGAVFLLNAFVKGSVLSRGKIVAAVGLSMLTGLTVYMLLIGLGVDTILAGAIGSMIGSTGEVGYNLVAKWATKWMENR